MTGEVLGAIVASLLAIGAAASGVGAWVHERRRRTAELAEPVAIEPPRPDATGRFRFVAAERERDPILEEMLGDLGRMREALADTRARGADMARQLAIIDSRLEDMDARVRRLVTTEDHREEARDLRGALRRLRDEVARVAKER